VFSLRLGEKMDLKLKDTLLFRLFTLWKFPLVHFCRPKVIELNDQKCIVKIPLKRRTKNHLNCMYFGALCIGADLVGGIIAIHLIRQSKRKISFLFKDVKGNFLKRVEGDAFFTCEDVAAIADIMNKTIATGERINLPIKITVTSPSILGDEPLAEFVLTISLKDKTKS